MPRCTGPQLLRQRKRAGFTQRDLARALGLSRQAIGQLEGRAVVDPTRAAAYLRALVELLEGSAEVVTAELE
jgi:transcriptional regulator with XRE-family HTH domain